MDLVEDDGLDYLFDDNSMDGHETIAEDGNATADTETQSRSAAKHTPEPQNEGGVGRRVGASVEDEEPGQYNITLQDF